jgi:hypothetical protein
MPRLKPNTHPHFASTRRWKQALISTNGTELVAGFPIPGGGMRGALIRILGRERAALIPLLVRHASQA